MREHVLRFVRDATYRLAMMSRYPAYRRRRGAAIFAFHNVVSDDGIPKRCDQSLHIPVSEFRDYLALIEDGHTIVPLVEIAQRIRRRQSVDGLAALTFDDAYRGMVRHALPVLAEFGIPATVFVVSDAAAAPAPYWWDLTGSPEGVPTAFRERALTELHGDRDLVLAAAAAPCGTVPTDLLPASWSEIRSAARAGFFIGSHSATHRSLVGLTPDALRAEFERSHAEIGAAIGTPPVEVSYPYGLHNASVLDTARRSGYAAGVTMRFELARSTADPLAIPRINVPAGISIPALACWSGGVRMRGTQ